jgi:predicted nucleic acid-binding protein
VVSGYGTVSDRVHPAYVDDAAREHFGTLVSGKKTKKMRRADMPRASTALGNKALLVTRNTKDYKDVQGLRGELDNRSRDFA